MIFARNSGGVFDQLIRERWASYQSTDMISNQSNIISTIIVTIFVVHINTPLPTPPPQNVYQQNTKNHIYWVT